MNAVPGDTGSNVLTVNLRLKKNIWLLTQSFVGTVFYVLSTLRLTLWLSVKLGHNGTQWCVFYFVERHNLKYMAP